MRLFTRTPFIRFTQLTRGYLYFCLIGWPSEIRAKGKISMWENHAKLPSFYILHHADCLQKLRNVGASSSKPRRKHVS